ncbi:MAG: ATP-dependent RNA helicase [Spirochaetales bacterium]|uniref:RNA helicase n=1 Tax=Candidatus Thalassospirochaeta sargassi TaxID=3119039 RepID=A0AAJ1IDU5_9SPIO|nr:ATP-dependent RNA helicase [Spirochaetales bacterium]
MNPEDLPVYREKARILEVLEKNQIVVVESPTGSGKTTQLPLILHEAGYDQSGLIGVTQPRRIATLSVCDYISNQLKVKVGGFAGYKMRFEDITSPETRIKIMTDGILLQELKADPYLSRYSVIMIDEAHERSLNIDFILGLLKKLLESRSDLKVIISSATINTAIFSEYFNHCPVIHIDTETFPVEISYQPPLLEHSEESMLRKIVEITENHARNKTGDVLVFLQGEKVIKDCVKMLSESSVRKKLFLLPLYGRLSREEQERVFIETPPGKIKVVVATNIAETSVTIDGITAVIDSGYAKINFYSPRNYTSSLVEKPISKASCNQRKGRAGRTQAGDCYRLYSKDDFKERDLFTIEEIYRTDLSEVVLRMAELGISDFNSFEFISPPGKEGLIAAVETLRMFGAIDDENGLTSVGNLMAAFPMLPRHSRMIVEAINRFPDVLEETITAASFLTAHSPYVLPQGEEMAARNAHHAFRDADGDFVSYLKLYESYMDADDKQAFCRKYYLDDRIMGEIANIKVQLEDIVREQGIPISGGGRVPDYLCAVSAGLMQFVCCRSGRGVYRSLTAEQISIHPGSVMFRETPKYIVAGEVVRTSRMFARSVSPLRREWLKIISEDLYYELIDTGSYVKDKDRQEPRDKREENRVRIGGKSFTVKPYKGGRKIVSLPWGEFRQVVDKIQTGELSRFKKMRGTVILKDGEFLSGVKLNNIIRICKVIDPVNHVTGKMPAAFYTQAEFDSNAVFNGINMIMHLYRKPKSKKQLGFITLHTDGNGSYWFTSGSNFLVSLEESLSSLEVIADELTDKSSQKQIGRVYRRLNEMMNI